MPIWVALVLCLLSVTGRLFVGGLLAASKRHELETEVEAQRRRIVKLIRLLLEAKVTGVEQGDA
jgi:hypothetical protein